MSGRALVFAATASLAVVLFGAVTADAVAVFFGMVSMLVAGVCLAVRTDDTTRTMQELLFDDPRH